MAGGKSRSSLDTYHSKRHFEQTPEPRGRKSRRKGNGYAIQMHDARRLHYDLRLELDGVLKSWAITRGPSLDPSDKRLAVRTEDHPVDYITFEGVIPEGHYGAGTVLLWDRGEWEPVGDPHEGMKKGKLSFRLRGERLKGRWALVRFKGKKNEKRENWLLIKERDDEASEDEDVVDEYKTSVTTGKDHEAIAENPEREWSSGKIEKAERKSRKTRKKGKQAKRPRFVKPALATLVDDVPSGKDWIFEMKFDGYRAMASASGDDVRIYTRGGLDWTDRFGALPDALANLDLNSVLLDGEIVVVDENGRSDFGALQSALKGQGGALSYFVFDLLHADGHDLRKKPLNERKKMLEDLLGNEGRKGPIFYTDHIENDGGRMYDTLCKKGFEGIIAKRGTQPYRSGRGKSWLKIKCHREQEFIIVGWSPSTRKRAFSSLLLALREGKKLRYAGRVGTGFSDDELDRLSRKFEKLERKTQPMEGDVPASISRKAHWLKPQLVAQIGFAEFTKDGLVRQARYLGLREDKKAEAVTREEPAPVEEVEDMASDQTSPIVEGVRISHPDKVLYPDQGITKLELARYLEKAAEWMLPDVENRLVSLVRCPEGRQKKCFFQRHAGAGLGDGFHELEVKGAKEREKYLYIDDAKGLVSAAQMGVLEFHIWGSRIDDIERPDRLVFDLDPDEEIPFDEVKRAARETRDVLDALGLKSFPMLTGGKGIHVIAPLVRRHEWPTVKAFAAAVANRMTDHDPKRYVAKMSKAARKGRIFIDYLRNDRASTAIAPYSPRARAGAPVAWPVSWDDLAKVKAANEVTVASAFKKRRGDPWKGYGKLRQSLKASALRALDIED